MELHFQPPEGKNIFILGDPSLLYSIFHNLIDNAIKYAGEGTCISLSAVETGDYWKFTLSDIRELMHKIYMVNARLFQLSQEQTEKDLEAAFQFLCKHQDAAIRLL